MLDRMHELLDFDLDLIDSIAQGGPLSSSETAAAERADWQRLPRPIRLAGFDEAGRGALAGPVAVACVHVDLGGGRDSLEFARKRWAVALGGLDDSKRLTARRRESLCEAITSVAAWGFGCASALEIDRWGIVHACRLAARRAYGKLGVVPNVGLFDRGLSLVEDDGAASLRGLQFTRGDARSMHIAAASVLAKVGRDAIMTRLDRRFSGYGLAQHKGYGTVAHRDAIRRLGPTSVHRRSFCTRIEQT